MLGWRILLGKLFWIPNLNYPKDTRFNEITEEEIEIYYYSPQKKIEDKLKMEDWDFLLYYFENPMSINTIVLEIIERRRFMKNITTRRIKRKNILFCNG